MVTKEDMQEALERMTEAGKRYAKASAQYMQAVREKNGSHAELSCARDDFRSMLARWETENKSGWVND